MTEEIPREPLQEPPGMSKAAKVKLIGIIALVALVLAIILLNTAPTEIDLLFTTITPPLWLLLLLNFLAGGAAGIVFVHVRNKRKERPLTGR